MQKHNKLLIADDDEDDRFIFKMAINDVEPDKVITFAEDGVILMEQLISNELPDIIFLDINMPRKNGLECLREIRSDGKFNDIPIVIYSTSAEQKHIDETYNNGANLYIRKPSDFSSIKDLVKKILNLNIDNYLPQPEKENFVLE